MPKCGLSWFLVVFHTMTYWKFGSVFIFFQNLGGSVIYKDAPCARGTSIHWYLPILEGAPYILPIFLRKSPYQNLRIPFFILYISLFEIQVSLPKFENFLLCLIILPIWKRKARYLSFQMYHMSGNKRFFFQQNFVKASENCLTNKKSFKFWKETIMKSVKNK